MIWQQCLSVDLGPSRWQWNTRLVPGHLEGVQSAENQSQVLVISLEQINAQIICSSEEVSPHTALFCRDLTFESEQEMCSSMFWWNCCRNRFTVCIEAH